VRQSARQEDQRKMENETDGAEVNDPVLQQRFPPLRE
jgi:hypothetical protein